MKFNMVYCKRIGQTLFLIAHSLSRYFTFYRAMDYSAKRGIAIVYCPSVCLSVRLSVRV